MKRNDINIEQPEKKKVRSSNKPEGLSLKKPAKKVYKPSKNENNLTTQEQIFIDNYLFNQDKEIRGNGTKCALIAYNITGEDQIKRENVASSVAYDVLRKSEIQEYISKRMKDTTKHINEDWIAAKITEILELSVKNDKMSESLRALELLGKWKAMFTDKNIVENVGSLADELDEIVESKAEKTEPAQPKSAKMKDFPDKIQKEEEIQLKN